MESIKIKEVTMEIVKAIVDKNYRQLYQTDYRKLISVSELRKAIEDYDLQITMPPDDAFENIEIFETKDKDVVKVDFDLWFDNKISDLTLSFAIYYDAPNWKYSIENIHML